MARQPTSTSTEPAAKENVPVSFKSRLPLPMRPTSLLSLSSSNRRSTSAATRTSPCLAVASTSKQGFEIHVLAPSSDPAGRDSSDGASDGGLTTAVQARTTRALGEDSIPTPPTSLSPQSTQQQRRTSISSSFPTLTRPRSRSRTSSSNPPPANHDSPALNASKPVRARRSISGTPTSTPKSKLGLPSARKSTVKKLVATPSRILDELPPGPDSDGEDPLLLKGAEEMCGPGEGTPRDEGSRSRRKSVSGTAKKGRRMSKSASVEAGGKGKGRRRVESSVSVDDTFNYTGASALRVAGQRLADEVWDDADLAPLGSGTLEDENADDEAFGFSGREDGEDGEEEDFGGHEDFWASHGLASDDDSVDGAQERTVVGSSPYRDQIVDYEVPIAPMTSSPNRPRASYSSPPPVVNQEVELSPGRSSSLALDLPGGWGSPVAPKVEEFDEEGADETIILEFSVHAPSPPAGRSLSPDVPSACATQSRATDQSSYDEDEEEEDSIVLVGQPPMLLPPSSPKKRSVSPARSNSAQIRPSPPPHSTPPRASTSAPNQDATMARSRPTWPTSPPPNAGTSRPGDDVHMTSPSPRRAPVASTSALGSSASAEPGPADSVMGSPSPIRRRGPSPTSLEKLRSGGNVGKGKELLAGKLQPLTASRNLFAIPEAPRTAPAPTPVPLTSQLAPAPRLPPRTASVAPAAPVSERAPRPSHPPTHTSTPHPLSTRNTSTFTSQLSTFRRSRPRPSHPTLPIVEISSTDPKAAARAAAILKVYHSYVEEGLAAPPKSHAFAFAAASSEDEVEEELQELLEEAEEELASIAPRYAGTASSNHSGRSRSHSSSSGSSVRFDAHSRSSSAGSAAAARNVPTPTPTPTSSRRAQRGSSESGASPVPTNTRLPWTSVDWRRLEQAVVDETRSARREGRPLQVEGILEEFLENEGLEREDCKGEWQWDKLVVRITALQERRAVDAAKKRSDRASSAGTAILPPSLGDELHQASSSTAPSIPSVGPSVRDSSVGGRDEYEEEDQSQEEEEEEKQEQAGSDSGSERDEMEDTFYERPRQFRAAPVEEEEDDGPVVHPPPALANSRFAHLYDDPIAKPPLPPQTWGPLGAKREETPEYDTSGEGSRERSGTPEQSETASQAPSSTRKIFSYLGALVRRSPALPSPSPEPEMAEVRAPGRLLVTPSFASTFQPFPTRPHTDRPVRPLPAAVPSTSAATPGPPPRRRRSSGEGKVWDQINAIEDAESSREEDARVIELLQSGGGVKRRASQADLGGPMKPSKLAAGGTGEFEYGTPVKMIPSGLRASDRPIGSRASRGAGGRS